MRFIAKFSTDDGALTEGKVYQGNVVMLKGPAPVLDPVTQVVSHSTLRVAVYDNRGELLTFNPQAFVPFEEATWTR